MIEIVFSDSACGSLKVAQSYGKGKYIGGAFSVIVTHQDGSKPSKQEIARIKKEAEEKERRAWENAVPLGGKASDVFGFHLALSYGDIDEEAIGEKREQALDRLFGIYPENEGNKIRKELIQQSKNTLQAVMHRAEMGEDIRIWYSDMPDELCGMYWFMEQLNKLTDYKGQVYLVKQPECDIKDDNTIVRHNGWGDVCPSDFHKYLPLQKAVPKVFCKSCAAHWRELKTENAPLRAVLNSRLVSVPENIYDNFILKVISVQNNEFHEAMVVGRVLGEYQLGIGDEFIALRIEEMIKQGKLEAVTKPTDDAPIYRRTLRKLY